MLEIKVTKDLAGVRLDKFVKKHLANAPSSFIYKIFRKEDVKVNGKKKKMDFTVSENDIVTIYLTKEQENDFYYKKEVTLSQRKDFEVIYEDENIIVVNKPSNLLVYDGDDRSKKEDTLISQVLAYLKSKGEYDEKSMFAPSLAHRIDRNTTGIVIIGKTSAALSELFAAFKDHEGMEKEYETLVCGSIKEKGRIEAKLIKNEKTKIVNVDNVNGLEAKTSYEPIRTFGDVTLLKVNIFTGRTHQIRVHLKYIGHPLVGDQKYGNANSDLLAKKYKMTNYFLHARKLVFHNLSGSLGYLNNMEFIAPLFKNEQDLINNLKGD